MQKVGHNAKGKDLYCYQSKCELEGPDVPAGESKICRATLRLPSSLLHSRPIEGEMFSI